MCCGINNSTFQITSHCARKAPLRIIFNLNNAKIANLSQLKNGSIEIWLIRILHTSLNFLCLSLPFFILYITFSQDVYEPFFAHFKLINAPAISKMFCNCEHCYSSLWNCLYLMRCVFQGVQLAIFFFSMSFCCAIHMCVNRDVFLLMARYLSSFYVLLHIVAHYWHYDDDYAERCLGWTSFIMMPHMRNKKKEIWISIHNAFNHSKLKSFLLMLIMGSYQKIFFMMLMKDKRKRKDERLLSIFKCPKATKGNFNLDSNAPHMIKPKYFPYFCQINCFHY